MFYGNWSTTFDLDNPPQKSMLTIINGEVITGTTPFTLQGGRGHLIITSFQDRNLLYEIIVSNINKKIAVRDKEHRTNPTPDWYWTEWRIIDMI